MPKSGMKNGNVTLGHLGNLASTGQRVESIFALAALAVEQHRRRVSTSVVNEVLKEALSWRSPPTTRGGRQGKLYYGTQVASRPPQLHPVRQRPQIVR